MFISVFSKITSVLKSLSACSFYKFSETIDTTPNIDKISTQTHRLHVMASHVPENLSLELLLCHHIHQLPNFKNNPILAHPVYLTCILFSEWYVHVRMLTYSIVANLACVSYVDISRKQTCTEVQTTRLMPYSYCLFVNSYRKCRNFDVVAKHMTSRRQLNNVIFYSYRAHVLESRIRYHTYHTLTLFLKNTCVF